MRTDDLIRAMAADPERSRPVAVGLALSVLLVAVGLAAIFLPMMGARPNLGMEMLTPAVLVKQAFPPLVVIGATGAALRLARPGMGVGAWALVLVAVGLMLAAAAGTTMAAMPASDWMPTMMGQSAFECLALIALMSLPFLAATLWALRGGASTRPVLSGALAGLLSGGGAALVYSWHCTEDSPLFYAVWYVLAILIVTGAGALLGSRVLRW